MEEVKKLLIKKITEKGFPVIVWFDYMDANAGIYAKSEKEVVFDGAYGEDMQEGKGTTIQDITPEGLFNLFQNGVRPGEEYWQEHLADFEAEPGDDGEDS
jgi:hypothetical protein